MSEHKIYQLKVTLEGIDPPIWRRFQVPRDISLFELHLILQIVMGWTNSHLHEFQIQGERYSTPRDGGFAGEKINNDHKFKLEEVLPPRGESFSYRYDFGDCWDHLVEVEEILPLALKRTYPCCLGGARACPPEDVGGVWGYGEFLEAIKHPNHPEHELYLNWVGKEFDPDKFDLNMKDAELNNYQLTDLVRIHERYYPKGQGPRLKLYQGITRWNDGLSDKQLKQLADLPLRRDVLSLLSYLRDHDVRGTQSTGNLPLKAVRDIAARFVRPPELDTRLGDRVYKLRSEFDVWPLYFVHILAEVGGLITRGKGKKLRLTRKGKLYLDQEPPIQVWFLLETWWFHTNWLIAYSARGMGETLSHRFSYLVLDVLLSLDVGREIFFEEFADTLIKSGHLQWHSENQTYAQNSLRNSIKRMIIDILKKFQAVELEYRTVDHGGYTTKDLWSFKITELGAGLMKALAARMF